MNTTNNLISIFDNIEDPRSHINQLHDLVNILLLGIILVISGAQTWKQMLDFAYSKEDFLRKFLNLDNGIPSEDTINRFFSVIDSSEFENCFIEWVNSISIIEKGQVIV
ncbi:ISAs1 family transposase [Flavobacterium psychrophilum]